MSVDSVKFFVVDVRVVVADVDVDEVVSVVVFTVVSAADVVFVVAGGIRMTLYTEKLSTRSRLS